MRESTLIGHRYIAVFAFMGIAGCASTATPTPRPESAYIPGASGALVINPGQGPMVKAFAAPIDQVWRLMPAAFDSLGIPLTIVDPRRHVIGNEGVKLHQKLGAARLSTYFDCGNTQVGPNADSYELYITIISQLEPDKDTGTGTRLVTTTSAAARPLQFAQDYSRCSSKDVLEAKIAELVAAGIKK